MHFCIVQVQQAGAIFVQSFGQFRPSDMQSLFKTLGTLDLYEGARILHDMRNVDFSVPVDEVIKVAHARPAKNLNTRLALLANSEVGFGMLRVIVAIRENASRSTNAFRSVSDALDWLNIPGIRDRLPDGIENVQSKATPLRGEMNEGYGLVFHKLSFDDAVRSSPALIGGITEEPVQAGVPRVQAANS